jgi:hypothetical protein
LVVEGDAGRVRKVLGYDLDSIAGLDGDVCRVVAAWLTRYLGLAASLR